MICPNCGYDIPAGKHRCLRCGYECKDLALATSDSDRENEEPEKEPEDEVIDIDPRNVYISGGETQSRGSGSILDEIFGGGIFGGGLFGSLFGDIFGGFGYDDDDYEDEEPEETPRRKAGETVVVRDVEIIDKKGNTHKSRNGKINDGNVGSQPEEKKPFDKLRDLRKKRKDGNKN